VPYHAGKIIKPAVLQQVMNRAGLDVEELRRLL
jgi:hypothetical protein